MRAGQALQLAALKLPVLLEHPADEVDLAVEVLPGDRGQAARGARGSDHAGRIERTADTRGDDRHLQAVKDPDRAQSADHAPPGARRSTTDDPGGAARDRLRGLALPVVWPFVR